MVDIVDAARGIGCKCGPSKTTYYEARQADAPTRSLFSHSKAFFSYQPPNPATVHGIHSLLFSAPTAQPLRSLPAASSDCGVGQISRFRIGLDCLGLLQPPGASLLPHSPFGAPQGSGSLLQERIHRAAARDQAWRLSLVNLAFTHLSPHGSILGISPCGQVARDPTLALGI